MSCRCSGGASGCRALPFAFINRNKPYCEHGIATATAAVLCCAVLCCAVLCCAILARSGLPTKRSYHYSVFIIHYPSSNISTMGLEQLRSDDGNWRWATRNVWDDVGIAVILLLWIASVWEHGFMWLWIARFYLRHGLCNTGWPVSDLVLFGCLWYCLLPFTTLGRA